MPFPKRDEWQAPWEKSGEDFDAERAATLIYNLSADNHGLKESKAAVETERDEALTKVKEFERKDETEADRVKRERDEALAAAQKAQEGSASNEALRYKVALDKGLTLSQAKRLVGNTEEELAADADDLLKDLGSGEHREAGSPLSRLPQRRRSGSEREEESPTDGISVEEYLAKHARRR